MHESSVAVSDSLGQVGVIELCPTGPKLLQVWRAHSYEAWIVCFGHCSDILFSGGDDCKLHCWDLRKGTDKPSATSKCHEMGICSLQSHPTDDNILASGSYDEHLALWDIRNLSRPFKEKSLGGGLWRIKWNPFQTNIIAAACMHNHFCIVDVHMASSRSVQVLEEYKEHKSLAYGVDWCRTYECVDVCKRFTLASCSFYDHSLHLWTTLVNTH